MREGDLPPSPPPRQRCCFVPQVRGPILACEGAQRTKSLVDPLAIIAMVGGGVGGWGGGQLID